MDLAAIVAGDQELQRIVDAWPDLHLDDQLTIARIVELALGATHRPELMEALGPKLRSRSGQLTG